MDSSRVRPDSEENNWLWNCHVSITTFHAKISSTSGFSKIPLKKIQFFFFYSDFLFLCFILAQSKAELHCIACSMAQIQLLSPGFSEALKFQNPLPNGCSRSPWRTLVKTSSSLSLMGHGGRRRRGFGRVRVATEGSPSTDAVADDYYSVLGLVFLLIWSGFCLNMQNIILGQAYIICLFNLILKFMIFLHFTLFWFFWENFISFMIIMVVLNF